MTQEVTLYEHTAVRSQDNFEQFIEKLGTPRVHRVDIAFREPLRAELEAFIHARQTGDIANVVSSTDAARALGVALEAVEQIKQKGHA